MTADAIDLCTIADAHSYLKIPTATTGDDTYLQSLVTACSQNILTFLGRDIKSQSYTEYYDGNGQTSIMLDQFPVTAVSSVTIDGNALTASTGPQVSGYGYTKYKLFLRGACSGVYNVVDSFPVGYSNVYVAYTAGYTVIPRDIGLACAEWVGLIYRDREHIGERSKNIGGDISVSYDSSYIPDRIKMVLNQYKKML